MATAQRLKKLTPTDVWSSKEKLCLASSVMRSGDQNWVSVSRAIKPFGEPNRPADWFSQKNCALQYSELLEKVETPKRKRGERGENETPGESIVRNLTAERVEELKKLIQQDRQNYMRLKRLVDSVKSGAAEENLQELWEDILEEKKQKKLEEQKYQVWLQERENAKQAALAALKTVKITPNSKRPIVKRLVIARRSSSQSEHGSEPESNMESPLNEPLIVDNVGDDLLTSHECVPNMPVYSSSVVGPMLTPPTSTSSPAATSTSCHHSPLLNNLLRSTSQSPSTVSPTKEVSPRSQAALFSPTITSLLSATSNIPPLPTSVASLLTTALTGPPDSDTTPPRPPAQSPSQGAPTLLKLLDMPLGIPGKLPPLPIINNPEPIPLVLLPPQSLAKLTSSTVTTTSMQAPIASVAVKLDDQPEEPTVASLCETLADVVEGDLTMEVKLEVLEHEDVEQELAAVVEEDPLVVTEEISVVEEVTIVEEVTDVVEEVVEEVGVDVVEVVDEVDLEVEKPGDEAISSMNISEVVETSGAKDILEVKKEPEEKEAVVMCEVKKEVECEEPTLTTTSEADVIATPLPEQEIEQPLELSLTDVPKIEEKCEPPSEIVADIGQDEDKPDEVQNEKPLESILHNEKTVIEQPDEKKEEEGEQVEASNVDSEDIDAVMPDEEEIDNEISIKIMSMGTMEENVEEEEERSTIVPSADDEPKVEVTEETNQAVSDVESGAPIDIDSSDEEDVPLLNLLNKSRTTVASPVKSAKKDDDEKEKDKVDVSQGKKSGPGKAWRRGLKGSASEAAAILKSSPSLDEGRGQDSDAGTEEESDKESSANPEDPKSDNAQGVGKGKRVTRKGKDKNDKEATVSSLTDTEVEVEVVLPKPTRRSKEEIPKAGGKHKTSLTISKGSLDIDISDDDERNSDREDSNHARGTVSSGDELDSTRDYRVWKKAIMLVWRAVANHKYANVFLHPVTDEEAPGYQIVVNRPMDLQTIKRNIESGHIRTTVEFQRDVMLMFQNAIMYNSSDHDVFKMAIEMQKEVMGHIQDFLATQLMVQTTGVPLTLRRETREQTMKRSETSDKMPLTPSPQSGSQERRASQILSRASFLPSEEPGALAPRTRTASAAEIESKDMSTAKRKRSFGDSDGGKVKKRRTRADD